MADDLKPKVLIIDEPTRVGWMWGRSLEVHCEPDGRAREGGWGRADDLV